VSISFIHLDVLFKKIIQAQKVKKERKLKTDPRVLARQRESYHKRKQRRQSNEIIGSGSETNPSSGNLSWG